MKKLRDLYQEHLKRLCEVRETFPKEDLHGPFLLEPTTYFKQPTKLLIIGQETNGWCCDYKDIDAQLRAYRKFNMGERCGRSPFCNITRKIEAILGIPRYSCAWSNLNRFDHKKHAPKGGILHEISKLDFLVKDEIQILNPDVCMLFTNRKYDYRIKSLYADVEFQNIEGLPHNHFCKLVHDDLPELTFRTPHPRTIRTQKWEDAFLDVMRKTLKKEKMA